jgi:hypothetical protein
VTRRRPRVDFYHLFDEDELFFAPIILIAKRYRVALSVATVLRNTVGIASLLRSNIGVATIHKTKTQG